MTTATFVLGELLHTDGRGECLTPTVHGLGSPAPVQNIIEFQGALAYDVRRLAVALVGGALHLGGIFAGLPKALLPVLRMQGLSASLRQ